MIFKTFFKYAITDTLQQCVLRKGFRLAVCVQKYSYMVIKVSQSADKNLFRGTAILCH